MAYIQARSWLTLRFVIVPSVQLLIYSYIYKMLKELLKLL